MTDELLQILKEFVEYTRTESHRRLVEADKQNQQYREEYMKYPNTLGIVPTFINTLPLEPTIPEFIKWYEQKGKEK